MYLIIPNCQPTLGLHRFFPTKIRSRMIAYFLDWFFYSSLFFFLDIFFQNFFYQQILFFTLILTITSIKNGKPFGYFLFLLALLLIESTLSPASSAVITYAWIPLLLISRYIRSFFANHPLSPYLLLGLCLVLKTAGLKLIFGIESNDWLYTIGQFIANIIILSFSLKWLSAAKASNRL